MDPVTVSALHTLLTMGGVPLAAAGVIWAAFSLFQKVNKMEKTLEQMAKIINQVDRRLLTIEIHNNIEP